MRATTALFVACSLVLWTAPGLAQAQEHHEAPAHPEAHAEDAHAHDAHAHDAHGDDAHGAHHHDPSADDDGDGVPNWRDRTTGDEPNEHYVVSKTVFHAINLLILLGVLGWFGIGSIRKAIKGRAHDIRDELQEAARLREEAERRHAEITERLDRFEDEVAALNADTERRAKAEEARLMERATTAAEQIRETTERHIADEVARARTALRREAVELAVQLAEKTLHDTVAGDDHRRLARQFLDSLEAEDRHG